MENKLHDEATDDDDDEDADEHRQCAFSPWDLLIE